MLQHEESQKAEQRCWIEEALVVRLAVGLRLGEPLTRDPYDQRVDGWLRYSLCGMKRAFPASSDITDFHVSAQVMTWAVVHYCFLLFLITNINT